LLLPIGPLMAGRRLPTWTWRGLWYWGGGGCLMGSTWLPGPGP